MRSEREGVAVDLTGIGDSPFNRAGGLRKPVAQFGGCRVPRRVSRRIAAALVEWKVEVKPWLAAGQRAVLGGVNLRGTARHSPEAHIVDAAIERAYRTAGLARAANQERARE